MDIPTGGTYYIHGGAIQEMLVKAAQAAWLEEEVQAQFETFLYGPNRNKDVPQPGSMQAYIDDPQRRAYFDKERDAITAEEDYEEEKALRDQTVLGDAEGYKTNVDTKYTEVQTLASNLNSIPQTIDQAVSSLTSWTTQAWSNRAAAQAELNRLNTLMKSANSDTQVDVQKKYNAAKQKADEIDRFIGLLETKLSEKKGIKDAQTKLAPANTALSEALGIVQGVNAASSQAALAAALNNLFGKEQAILSAVREFYRIYAAAPSTAKAVLQVEFNVKSLKDTVTGYIQQVNTLLQNRMITDIQQAVANATTTWAAEESSLSSEISGLYSGFRGLFQSLSVGNISQMDRAQVTQLMTAVNQVGSLSTQAAQLQVTLNRYQNVVQSDTVKSDFSEKIDSLSFMGTQLKNYLDQLSYRNAVLDVKDQLDVIKTNVGTELQGINTEIAGLTAFNGDEELPVLTNLKTNDYDPAFGTVLTHYATIQQAQYRSSQLAVAVNAGDVTAIKSQIDT